MNLTEPPLRSALIAITVNNSAIKTFSTSRYDGAWFSFSGDRMKLRLEIEAFLRIHLNDPSGLLEVVDTGPYWRGSVTHHLSYSHTEGSALLVHSSTHPIGVDLEPVSRPTRRSPLEVAERYFHENEFQALAARKNSPALLHSEFLDLWLKKESYAKLTRKGLKIAIHLEVATLTDVGFERVPISPVGFRAVVALLPLKS